MALLVSQFFQVLLCQPHNLFCNHFNFLIISEYGNDFLFGPWFLLLLDYAIIEKPLLAEDMQGGLDYIVLKTLDTDSIRIIGSVLGQSIALDYFVSQVILHLYPLLMM